MGKLIFFVLSLSLAAQGSFTSLEAEELKWRNTELTLTWPDNTITEKYCAANERFFRGCVAMIENMAKQIDPQLSLSMASKSQFALVKDAQYKVPQTDLEVKAFWKKERARYVEIENMGFPQATQSLILIYQKLKTMKSDFAPYEVARMINAAASYTYDSANRYRPSYRYDALPISIVNAIMGVSFTRKNGPVEIFFVLRGSEAEKAGIKKGDVLTSIDGQSVRSMSEAQFEATTQRAEGSKIKLAVMRNGVPLSFALSFKKANILDYELKTVNYSGKKWSYLAIDDFEILTESKEQLCATLQTKLKEANSRTEGLLLDLRGNGGGDTSLASCVLGLFIGESKSSLQIKNVISQDITETLTTEDSKKVYEKPIVVLQDGGTASAAEMISGNLKIRGRALVLGNRSYGKGTAQTLSTISRVEHIETAYVYYLADGSSPQLKGINPQLEVYRFEKPAPYEVNSLREEDVGIHPVEAGTVAPFDSGLRELAVPQSCIEKKNVVSQYKKMSDYNPNKDLQLLTGLASLDCMGQ